MLSCNWNTVKVFLLLANDWERKGLGGTFMGIPSPAVQSVQAMSGITLSPDEFLGLKLMEAAAKPILNRAIQDKK